MKEDEDCVVRAVDLTRKLCLVRKSMEKYVESELVPMNGLKGEDLSNIKIKKATEELGKTTAHAPEMDKNSRQDILKQVKRIAESIYHPVGTRKMGNFRNQHKVKKFNQDADDLSVVDPLLRVHGILNLHVADASIMPQITSGNTNAPSIMIGERCAEIVFENVNQT